MIALLAGTLGVFGCSDDPKNGNGGSGGSAGSGGTGGSGGSGGTAADACTSGDCADSSADVQAACGTVKAFCNSEDCCTLPGTGGAGGTMMIDPDPDTCDAAGQYVCERAGAGGTGGDGGTGGSGTQCDYTAKEICELCDSQDAIPDCESTFDACLANPPSGALSEVCDKCTVIARSECGL